MPDADLEYDLDQPVTMTKREIINFGLLMSDLTSLAARGPMPDRREIARRHHAASRMQATQMGIPLRVLDDFIRAGNCVPTEGLP